MDCDCSIPLPQVIVVFVLGLILGSIIGLVAALGAIGKAPGRDRP